jgi:eukaryotic-like serine/threonine-protein kinase
MLPLPYSGTPFGRYLLGRRLAEGGMGEVFEATQLGPGGFRKALAIKLLLPHLESSPEQVELFESEARLAAGLQHPGIVQIFDVGVVDGRHFIAMELVDGVSLSEVVEWARNAGRSISATFATFVANGVLEALHEAHQLHDASGKLLGLVHRDVSLSNILLSRKGELKLTDFGIAKTLLAERESYTDPGTLRGKLAYLAPELVYGGQASVQADLYAMGVVLLKLLTPPSTSSSPATPGPPDASVVLSNRTDLPAELRAVLQLALSAQPSKRFVDALSMRNALPKGDQSLWRAEAVALLNAFAPVSGIPDNGSPPATSVIDVELSATQLEGSVHPSTQRRARDRRALAVGAGITVLIVAAAGASLLQSPRQAESVALNDTTPALPQQPAADTLPAVFAVEPPDSSTALALEPLSLERQPTAPSRVTTNRRENTKVRGRKIAPPALLTIQVKPWAEVEIDGHIVGQTPLVDHPVERASPVIRFIHPDFPTQVWRPTLAAGSSVRYSIQLKH